MKRLTLLAAFLVLVPFTTAACAEPLPRAQPGDVGLSAERLDRVSRVLRDEIEKGKFPGAVALVARKGKIAYFESFGARDLLSGTPITSVAVMMLQEEGRLVLTDPISKFLPQLTKLQVAVERTDPATGKATFELVPAQREITIQDLLRHTSGFAYGARTRNAMVK